MPNNHTFLYTLTDNDELNVRLLQFGGEALNRFSDFINDKQPNAEAGIEVGPWMFEHALGADGYKFTVKVETGETGFHVSAAGILADGTAVPISLDIVQPAEYATLMNRVILGKTNMPHIDALLASPRAEAIMDQFHQSVDQILHEVQQRDVAVAGDLGQGYKLVLAIGLADRTDAQCKLAVVVRVITPEKVGIAVPIKTPLLH